MSSDEPIRVKFTDLPRPLEIVGPNGEIVRQALMPSKGKIGAFVNSIGHLRNLLTRKK